MPITFFGEKLEIISGTLMFLYLTFVMDFEGKKTYTANVLSAESTDECL